MVTVLRCKVVASTNVHDESVRPSRAATRPAAPPLRKTIARAMIHDREQLLSNVAHDLKSPLGVILMTTAYLLDSMPANDRRRTGRGHLETIQRSAWRMKRLVADLLDFDALASGSFSLSPRRMTPRSVVGAAYAEALPLATAGGVRLRRAPLVGLPIVWADPDRVVQVLTNLLSNAVKFTPRGGRVTVSATGLSEAEVGFSVQDSGSGITEQDLPHVFERGWQARATARLGSGLGLAICKSLVELSGGRIWAESTLGKGTTVTFTLPTAPPSGRRVSSRRRTS